MLACLRIYLGLTFLNPSVHRLFASGFQPRMEMFLQNVAPNASPFYGHFLTSFVLPHSAGFAVAVEIGELTVGALLLTGAATRLASLGAMFLLVNYMLAKGLWFWQASSNDAAFFAIALALLLGAAGRTFGLDRYLAERWPAVPLW